TTKVIRNINGTRNGRDEMRIRALTFMAVAAASWFSIEAKGAVSLGTAGNFAVLAGSAVTNTGPTLIEGGSVGVSPGSAVTGFPPGIVTAPFTIHSADAVALQAQADLT